MSSILEALKKLEAEKYTPQSSEIVSAADADYSSNTLLADLVDGPGTSRTMAPLLWVLGGGVFTVLIIGVVVLVVMLLLQQNQSSASQYANTTPAPTAASPSEPVAPEPVSIVTPEVDAPAPDLEPTGPTATDEVVTTPVSLPKMAATAPEPAKAHSTTPPAVAVPAHAPQEARPPAPVAHAAPAPAKEVKVNNEPLPPDIRSLPMLSRQDRGQYRLDGIQLNMLNEQGPTRPIGNAFINLEKVFIGEFLPGSNAKLIDVKSFGVAVEIQSTGQRFYIPR